MDTFEAIKTRRAVKHFDPNHKFTDAEIDQLFSLAVLSPTSFNIQNWRFVAVTDPDQRAKLQEAAWGQKQITEASLPVVLCADLKSYAKNPERYWHNAPDEVKNQLVPMIGKFYEGDDQLQRDEAMRSCGIAAQTLMLSARAMGYDSCPMIGFDPDAVAKIINLPTDHTLGLIVTIGKALQPARPRGGQLTLNEVVIQNKW